LLPEDEAQVNLQQLQLNTKLSRHIFSDSKVGSKLSYRRTKAEDLVTNVLALSSVTDFMETS
jgi:hypothetical protein